jgi:hypothetical protein
MCSAAIATSKPSRRVAEPGAARLGELLCGQTFQQILQLHQGLGGKEDQAPYAGGSETKGVETVV